MGTIIEIPAPTSAGRHRRVSDEDLSTLADKIRAGSWVSDGEGAHVKSCAYQRAQSVQKQLFDRFGINSLKTTAYPHPDHKVEILDLENQIGAIEKDAEGVTVVAQVEQFRNECVQLRAQILALGGYLWGLGPRS